LKLAETKLRIVPSPPRKELLASIAEGEARLAKLGGTGRRARSARWASGHVCPEALSARPTSLGARAET
jgi:hypothetical protein